MERYLDNSATTRVYPAVAEKIVEMMTVNYGNPSSLHTMGMKAEEELNNSRHIIAKSLGAEDEEIYFTSGGTEANNLALLGAVKAMSHRGNKIITTAVEHSSVFETSKELASQGFSVEYVYPDKEGNFKAEQFYELIDKDTVLVSVMAVNNEIGNILPIGELKKIIKEKQSLALLHCDCVQAFCKIPLKLSKLGVDLASISAHKIHGPKGVGALFVSKNARIMPIYFGGEQEEKLRPGTEAVPLIAGFGKAVEISNIDKDLKAVTQLNEYARNKLAGIEGITINSPQNALPYILSICVEGIRSETMLHYLEMQEVYVSSGSACAKGKPSHVLKALKMDKNRADSTLRISFSADNTFEDIDALCETIETGLNKLVRR